MRFLFCSDSVVDALSELDDSAIEERTEIKYKLLQFVLVAAACVLSLYLLADAVSPLYKLAACGMAINLSVFWSYWFFLLLRAKRLHRIRSVIECIYPLVHTGPTFLSFLSVQTGNAEIQWV